MHSILIAIYYHSAVKTLHCEVADFLSSLSPNRMVAIKALLWKMMDGIGLACQLISCSSLAPFALLLFNLKEVSNTLKAFCLFYGG